MIIFNHKVINFENELIIWAHLMVRQSYIRLDVIFVFFKLVFLPVAYRINLIGQNEYWLKLNLPLSPFGGNHLFHAFIIHFGGHTYDQKINQKTCKTL